MIVRGFMLVIAFGGVLTVAGLAKEENRLNDIINQEELAYEAYMGKDAYEHTEELQKAYRQGMTDAYEEAFMAKLDGRYNIPMPRKKPEVKHD